MISWLFSNWSWASFILGILSGSFCGGLGVVIYFNWKVCDAMSRIF